jgi:hypothetical protein
VRLLLLLGALAFMLPLPARSSVRLPEVLGDHMVLQQNTEVTFWGWASVGRTVQVETSWGEKAVTHAQPDGSWQVKIKTPAAQPLAQGLPRFISWIEAVAIAFMSRWWRNSARRRG